MSNSEFPKDTNSLLTTEEKVFLDGMPDDGVLRIITNTSSHINISFVAKDLSFTEYHVFNDDRADAVRDYYAMLIAFGVRNDPRVP